MDGTTAGPHCLNSRRDKQGPISFTSKPNSRLPCTWSRATDRRPDRAHVSTAPWTFGAPRTAGPRRNGWSSGATPALHCTAPHRTAPQRATQPGLPDPGEVSNSPWRGRVARFHSTSKTSRAWPGQHRPAVVGLPQLRSGAVERSTTARRRREPSHVLHQLHRMHVHSVATGRCPEVNSPRRRAPPDDVSTSRGASLSVAICTHAVAVAHRWSMETQHAALATVPRATPRSTTPSGGHACNACFKIIKRRGVARPLASHAKVSPARHHPVSSTCARQWHGPCRPRARGRRGALWRRAVRCAGRL